MRKTLQFGTLLFVSMFSMLSVFAAGIGSANVKFGKPDKNNADCAGKGVCMLSVDGGAEGSVNVSFVLIEDPRAGFYTLTMQFNISEMSSANHDYLYQYFLYPDGEPRPKFLFDQNYTLNNATLCRNLGIENGTVTITPTSTDGNPNIDKLNDSDIRLTYIIPMR